MVMNYMLVDGKERYSFSVSGCPPLASLSTEDIIKVYEKVKKISSGRGEWGTCSIDNKSVTINVRKLVE